MTAGCRPRPFTIYAQVRDAGPCRAILFVREFLFIGRGCLGGKIVNRSCKETNDHRYLPGTHVRQIQCAIHALPPFERTCVNLRYTEGMTTMDIACRLQCSRRQVTVALGDSYKILRQKLAYLSPSRSLPCPRRK
ncbi:MAG: sigma factor-like helix-turn-helix DNA-binding protein [Candidatus Cryosericum sp.]